MAIPIALRLAVRQWFARPLRPILCSIAISAAVALIICVGVAMDSLRFTLVTAIGRVLGVAEVHVRPAQRETDARVNQSMLDRVRALPEVELAGGRLHTMAVVVKGEDRLWYDVLGVDPVSDEQLRPKTYVDGGGLSADPAHALDQMMVDGAIAQRLNLKVGDTISYAQNENGQRTVKIVGILQRPTALEILAKPTLYVPLAAVWKDMAIPPEFNVLDVKLKATAGVEDIDAYVKDLGTRLGPTVEVAAGTSSKAKLTELTRTLALLLLLLSIMSAFCAALIIGTTLSVGVQERVRQFGQLRCIGASRGQLALFLLSDAAVMLVIGEGLGILLGTALSALLVAYFPQFFMAYNLTPASVAMAFGCGAFATLLGAAIPIWQVTRVSPMAAVSSVSRKTRPARVWLAGALGLACIALQVALWLFLPTRDLRFYGYVIVGIPLIFSGWCLLAPAVLLIVERAGAAVLGRLLAVRPALLRHTWSRTPWRAGAMIAALMIGVTLFTTVRARGQSLLASWTAPARIPDLIIKSFAGLSDSRMALIHKRHPELGETTLIDYFGVRLADKVFQLGALFGEGETTFIAVDPDAFCNMVELDYIEGDRDAAVKKLAAGGYVFVSKEFHNVRKLGVGDKLSFKGTDGKPVEFTIAAVVTSTGVELVKNYFDLRSSFSEKSVSSVLGSVADAKKYFKLGNPTLMMVNLTPGTEMTPNQMKDFRQRLETESGLFSVSSVEMKTTLAGLIRQLMDGLSVIGVGALCVASLGVANMVIASVHARRFEFGVLRAIGAGRAQLVRLVAAEVTLIGIVAGVLGAGAGLHFALMGGQIDYLLIGFPTTFLAHGFFPVLFSILGLTAVAICLTTVLAWAASLVPAIHGAFSAQRTLLASGRV